MESISSNIGSSSGGGSRGLPAPAWISLTLEEQLTNFKHIFCKQRDHKVFVDAPFFESVAKVVKKLRINPCVDIERLLLHIRDPHGLLSRTTPLHWAVLMDDITMVRYILTLGRVDINASTKRSKDTALHYAVIGGIDDMVEELLKHKANAGIPDRHGRSALYYSVLQKDSMFGILEMILANNVNICDEAKNTTLHHAARVGATDVVKYLLDKKADVNVCNKDGYTPLHCAAEKGSLDVVTCLLQQNANVNALNDYESSPLHLAAKKGAMDIVLLLLKRSTTLNTVDKRGWTPLLNSIIYRQVGTSNKLIGVGADVYVKDKWSNNALHLAIQAHDKDHNMIDIVKLLRDRDVDANAKNSKGYSPFFAAVVDGHTEVVKELLQNKEKIKLMEECNGQTAIQIAFDYGHEHIKRALLECNDVSRYVADLYRDRQVYVDAANAILVGAALIASVTFASWLQPPLGYTTFSDFAPSSSNITYVDVQHNVSLRAFWIFNALSFYFAIGTVVFGARSVLPRRHMFIKAIVVGLHQNLLVTSILLAFSVFFVIVAFGIAGCVVLAPTLKLQWYMIGPTICGGLVCLVSLGFLFKSMVEDNFKKKSEKVVLYEFDENLLDLRRI